MLFQSKWELRRFHVGVTFAGLKVEGSPSSRISRISQVAGGRQNIRLCNEGGTLGFPVAEVVETEPLWGSSKSLKSLHIRLRSGIEPQAARV